MGVRATQTVEGLDGALREFRAARRSAAEGKYAVACMAARQQTQQQQTQQQQTQQQQTTQPTGQPSAPSLPSKGTTIALIGAAVAVAGVAAYAVASRRKK